MLFEVGEEYLYQYQKPEQLEKAREAVESENRKNEILLVLTAKRTTFSIRKVKGTGTTKNKNIITADKSSRYKIIIHTSKV